MAFPTQPPLTLSQLPSGFGVTVQTYGPGTTSIPVPANTLAVILELWGAGGGGAAGYIDFFDFSTGPGAGGGSGACVGHLLTSSIPSSFTCSIGSGGTGGQDSNASGSAGNNTTISSLSLTAGGGGGGIGGGPTGGGSGGTGGGASGGNLFNRAGTPGNLFTFGGTALLSSIAHYGLTSAGAGGDGGADPSFPGSNGSGGQIRATFFGLGANTLRAYKPGDGQVANHANNQNPSDPNLVTLLQFLGASRSFATNFNFVQLSNQILSVDPFTGESIIGRSKGFQSSVGGSVTFSNIGKGVFVSDQANMVSLEQSKVYVGFDPDPPDSAFSNNQVFLTVTGDQTGTWWNEIGLENGKRLKRLASVVGVGSYDSGTNQTTWTWDSAHDIGFFDTEGSFTQSFRGPLIIDPDPRPSLAIDPSFDFVWSQAQGGYPFTRTYRAITANTGFSWSTTHPNANITSGQSTDTVQITYSGDGSGGVTVTTTSPSETASITVTTFTNINPFL